MPSYSNYVDDGTFDRDHYWSWRDDRSGLDGEVQDLIGFLTHSIDDEEIYMSPSKIDNTYAKWRTNIETLFPREPEYEIVNKYFRDTRYRGPYENRIYNPFEIMEIFKVDRHAEKKRLKMFKKLPNRRLLWHGTNHRNIPGILEHGLGRNRIGPFQPICFADRVPLAAFHCYKYHEYQPWDKIRFLLLCEVALGSP